MRQKRATVVYMNVELTDVFGKRELKYAKIVQIDSDVLKT